jgi:hypothetical protein
VDNARKQTVNPMAGPSFLPPEPRLQVNGHVELQNYLQRDMNLLKTYGWTDKAGGKVRIPIDRAMDIVAERGFPVRTESPAAAKAQSQGVLRQPAVVNPKAQQSPANPSGGGRNVPPGR